MRNQGSILTRPSTSDWIKLNAKRKRIAVTSIDIEVLLNKELKKKVKPRTAIRYSSEKSSDTQS